MVHKVPIVAYPRPILNIKAQYEHLQKPFMNLPSASTLPCPLWQPLLFHAPCGNRVSGRQALVALLPCSVPNLKLHDLLKAGAQGFRVHQKKP